METKERTNKRKHILDSVKSWNSEEKLKLIKEIEDSMKNMEAKKTIADFAGIWDDDPRSAEEIITEIKNARTFSRQLEDWTK